MKAAEAAKTKLQVLRLGSAGAAPKRDKRRENFFVGAIRSETLIIDCPKKESSILLMNDPELILKKTG